MKQASPETSSPKPSLRELQRALIHELTRPVVITDRLPGDIERLFDGDPQRLAECFRRYKGWHFHKLGGFVDGVFESTLGCLSNDERHDLISGFRNAHRSTAHQMYHYLEQFVDFVCQSSVCSTKPYLSDLCRLELLIARLLAGGMHEPRRYDDLWLSVDYATMSTKWNLYGIWSRREHELLADDLFAPLPTPQHLVLHLIDEGVEVLEAPRSVVRVLECEQLDKHPCEQTIRFLLEHGLACEIDSLQQS